MTKVMTKYNLVHAQTRVWSGTCVHILRDVQQRGVIVCVGACGCGESISFRQSSHTNEAGSQDQSLYLLNSVTERQQGCPAD